MNTAATFSIKAGQSQSDLIESVETMLDMCIANLEMVMATGQSKQFIVDDETVINSIWSVQMTLEQTKLMIAGL